MYKIFFILLSVFIFLVGCGDGTKKENETTSNIDIATLQKQAKIVFGTIPDKMPGSENDTPELIALGKKLYFEKRLSKNDTISCNSCHNIDAGKAGVDNLPTSPGAKGEAGERNSPTVYNAGFHFVQFWDGRAENLVDQVKEHILSPVEMAMPNEEVVVKKVSEIEEYSELFKKAFPDQKTAITYQNIAEALVAFERTLITHDRFDAFQKGDKKALTQDELIGLNKFIQTGCVQCHKGPLVGGDMYNKMGLINTYEDTKDLGRYNETKNEAEKFIFKVPSLRNIALTRPYFHNGQVKTLEEAVEKIAWLQLGKKLNAIEVKYIVKFLETLSDKKLTSTEEVDDSKESR